jgi:hypothetical protein
MQGSLGVSPGGMQTREEIKRTLSTTPQCSIHCTTAELRYIGNNYFIS